MSRKKMSVFGFTLVELLVVITIIGILIGLALPAYNRVKEAALELRVENNIHAIDVALQSFSTKNNGWYPGVAYDIDGVLDCVGGDSIPERSFSCDDTIGNAHPGVFPSAGILGGRMDLMITPGRGPFMTGSSNPDRSLWDRLYLDGDLETYPLNPFRTTENNLRPMMNVFEVMVTSGAGPAQGWVLECLSLPDVLPTSLMSFTGWYTDERFNNTARPITGTPGRFVIGGTTGSPTTCDDLTYNLGNGWEPGWANPNNYPSGDFSYIPLDPVENPDRNNDGVPDNAMYMVFVQNYFLIGYGARRSWDSKKVVNWEAIADSNGDNIPLGAGDGLKFYAPLGRINPADLSTVNGTPVPYEVHALRALRGAIVVQASAYNDQLTAAR